MTAVTELVQCRLAVGVPFSLASCGRAMRANLLRQRVDVSEPGLDLVGVVCFGSVLRCCHVAAIGITQEDKSLG